MTFTGDFLDEEGLEDDYPSAFGITFTPVVSGIALAILGIVGAVYIFMNMLAPAQEGYNSVEKQKEEKLAQLNQIKGKDYPEKISNLKSQLETERALKSRVTSMFTNQDDLETLLIDFSNFIAANRGILVKYSPDKDITIINDNYLGENVKGKLKKKGISVQIKGTYSQTQAIINNLEKLQPLLIIKNYESKVTEKPTAVLTSNRRKLVPKNPAILTTDLKIDAILPLSQKELEAAQKAAKQASQSKKK